MANKSNVKTQAKPAENFAVILIEWEKKCAKKKKKQWRESKDKQDIEKIVGSIKFHFNTLRHSVFFIVVVVACIENWMNVFRYIRRYVY